MGGLCVADAQPPSLLGAKGHNEEHGLAGTGGRVGPDGALLFLATLDDEPSLVVVRLAGVALVSQDPPRADDLGLGVLLHDGVQVFLRTELSRTELVPLTPLHGHGLLHEALLRGVQAIELHLLAGGASREVHVRQACLRMDAILVADPVTDERG